MQLCLGDTLHILDQEAGCFNGRFDLQMLFPFYIPNQVHSDRKKKGRMQKPERAGKLQTGMKIFGGPFYCVGQTTKIKILNNW